MKFCSNLDDWYNRAFGVFLRLNGDGTNLTFCINLEKRTFKLMTLSAIDDIDLNSPLHLVENTLFQVLEPELLRMNY
jgi:hypothetical protein